LGVSQPSLLFNDDGKLGDIGETLELAYI
jgi:hypothetical protein